MTLLRINCSKDLFSPSFWKNGLVRPFRCLLNECVCRRILCACIFISVLIKNIGVEHGIDYL